MIGKPKLTINSIGQAACVCLGISINEILGKGRREVSMVREIIVFIARRRTCLSFPKIANAFGRKSHSSFIEMHRRAVGKVDQPSGYSNLTFGQLSDEVEREAERLAGLETKGTA